MVSDYGRVFCDDFEVIRIPKKELELCQTILEQNKMILEMNRLLLTSISNPSFVVSKGTLDV